MSRINTFWASGEVKPADPVDETVINGAPYDAHKAIEVAQKTPQLPSMPRPLSLRRK